MSTQFYTKHFQQKTGAVAKPGGSYKARRLVLFFVTIKSTCMNIKNLFFIVFWKPMFNTRWFLDYCNAEWKQTYCGPTTKDTQKNLNVGTSLRKQMPLLHMLHLSSFLATWRDNLKQILKKNKDSLWIHVWSLPETILGKIPKHTQTRF